MLQNRIGLSTISSIEISFQIQATCTFIVNFTEHAVTFYATVVKLIINKQNSKIVREGTVNTFIKGKISTTINKIKPVRVNIFQICYFQDSCVKCSLLTCIAKYLE